MEKKILFAIIGGLVALVLLIILLSGGSSKPNGSYVDSIVFARSITPERTIEGDPVEVFTTNDPEISALVSFTNVPANSIVKYQWENLAAGQLILSEERAVKDAFTGNGVTKISKSSAQWGTGDFKLSVFVNDVLDATGSFVVKTPQQISQERFLGILGGVTFASSVDLIGKPSVAPTEVFSQDSTVIHASVSFVSAPKGTQFSLRWRYLPDDRVIKTFTKTVEGDGVFSAPLEARVDSWLPSRRFARGKYTVEVMINSQQVKEFGFTVD